MVHDPPTSDPALFRRRCRELGLFVWRYDRRQGKVIAPEETGLIGDWLRATRLSDAAEKIARRFIDETKPFVDMAFDGCWLFPVSEISTTSQAGLLIIMALGPQAADTDAFSEICQWASINPELARAELAPNCRHEREEMASLQQLLDWNYNDCIAMDRNNIAIEQFSENLVQAYEETHLLFRLARLMNCEESPYQLMDTLCHQFQAVMPFNWVAVLFGSQDPVFEDLRTRLILSGNIPCPRESFLVEAQRLIEPQAQDNWTRLLDPSGHPLAQLVNAEVAAEPIVHDNKQVGVLMAGNKRGPDPEMSSAETQFLDAASDFLGVFHENICRFADQHAMFMGTIHALTASLDAKDPYTHGHSERVSHLGVELAKAIGLEEHKIEQIRLSGLLHDVGKIGVPEEVLTKTGRLTDSEFELIKQHPQIGYNILKGIPPLAGVLPGVLYHHERFDGAGYPEGLRGDQIPVMGRILCVADSFDAMSSTRSYREAICRQKVLEELANNAGTQFDTYMVEKFLQLDFSAYDRLVDRHRERNSFAA